MASVLVLLLTTIYPAGCGETPSRAAEEGRDFTGGSEKIRAELKPVDGSGTTGTVTFVPAGGGTEVRLSLRSLPDPEAVYVGAIYSGTCAGETGGQGGRSPVEDAHREDVLYRFAHGSEHDPADDENIVQTLTSVAPGPDGRGASVTPLPTPAGELLSGGPTYVDVHGEDDAALACADLPAGDSSDA